jgi:plastocyanin
VFFRVGFALSLGFGLGAFLLSPALLCRGDVTGSVTIKGEPMSKDESFFARASGCGESPIRRTENWKIGPKGELGDVVVWVAEPKVALKMSDNGSQPLSSATATIIHQISCRYEPHVAVEIAGIPFKMVNGDPTLHNIRAKVYAGPGQPPGEDVFNFGQSYQGQMDEQQFDTPGTYTLQCDVHPWMQAWVMVLPKIGDGNFIFGTVSSLHGFVIADGSHLADGTYKIDAWHPRFAQTLEETVQVKNGVGTVNFVFDGAKSF